MFAKLIAGALIQDKGRKALRSMHIRACWHAIYRLNRARKFKANDFNDVEHAAAGVGYCAAIFTEISLATALTQSPVNLDREFGCLITHDMERAEGSFAANYNGAPPARSVLNNRNCS